MRDETVKTTTDRIDKRLADIPDKEPMEIPIAELKSLITMTIADQRESEFVWNPTAVAESLEQFAKLYGEKTGYIYIDRDRDLKENRRETQGILSGGEALKMPRDKIALFLLRTKPSRGKNAAWWPQVRFPDGLYAFAFAV